jgi:hypothetical protein
MYKLIIKMHLIEIELYSFLVNFNSSQKVYILSEYNAFDIHQI